MENKTMVINNAGSVEIEYYYLYNEDFDTANFELSEESIEHVTGLLKEGFREGELCELITLDNDEELEFYGWWKRV